MESTVEKAEKRFRNLAAVLMIGLLALAAWALMLRSERDQMALLVGNRYQQAFQEALDGVDRMEANLAKVAVTKAPSDQIPLLTEIWRDAGLAQAGIGQLPLPVGRMMRTSTFLAQAGDYAYSLVRQASRGTMPDDQAREQLASLSQEASQLATELHGIFDRAQAGPTGWLEIQRTAARGLAPPDGNALGDGLQRVEVQLEEVPTLTYDGPFSDHMTEREPRGLSGEPISEAEAERIARAFLPTSDRDRYQAQVTDRVQGRMPAFHVTVRPPENEEGTSYTFDVARQGGAVIWMNAAREVSEGRLERDEMRSRAEAFARERMEDQDLVAIDSVAAQDRVTFSLVPRVDGVLIYPDMVKVTVAGDNGEILQYDAQSYLMNHTERELKDAKLSEDEVSQRLSPEFEPDGPGRLALIPTDSLREILTYEYRGTVAGQRFILFLNADTGETEEILQVVPSSEGEVTR